MREIVSRRTIGDQPLLEPFVGQIALELQLRDLVGDLLHIGVWANSRDITLDFSHHRAQFLDLRIDDAAQDMTLSLETCLEIIDACMEPPDLLLPILGIVVRAGVHAGFSYLSHLATLLYVGTQATYPVADESGEPCLLRRRLEVSSDGPFGLWHLDKRG